MGFLTVIILVTALGIYNYQSVRKVNLETENIIDEQVQLLISNTQIANSMANGLRVTNSYLLTGDSKYKNQFDEFSDHGVHYADHMKKVLGEEHFDSTGVDLAAEWRASIIQDVFGEYDKGNEKQALSNLAELDSIGEESIETFSHWALVGEDQINELGQGVIKSGKTTLTVIVVVTLIVIILSVIASLITSRIITKPLNAVKGRMQLIAQGDLSMDPLITHSKDELGALVLATNEMQETTRGLLHNINRLSDIVSVQSEELTSTAHEVREGSSQMSSTMQELSSGAENQANSASDLSGLMDSFTSKINEANNNGQHVQETSAGVLDMTEKGSQLMVSSTTQMTKIDQIVLNAVQKVEGLDVHSQRISALVSVIQSLADQTNLLALNAAIEAARAGEHGKGFAVVADEVRKLAEQSSSSVTDITEIVHQIQSESSSVVASLQEGYQEVEQGTEQILTTGHTFNQISHELTEMVTNIGNVSNNLSEIVSSSQNMTDSIQEIAAISEESAAGIEQSSAASQQIGNTMEEVAEKSKDLSQLALELNELVGKFKL
ncbi:methyl-accepting chemotaxis protein [Sporosarcina sp. BI001-red]|uniref:methyl-accepting chemotaxis protein n=1 Tax=Sporosarcina sp. BI001-red TaxID=2282866 RepID=UPI001314B290|nr:HAMP domain-containing methyl-accepting chemotaxis protein [Sporosarcina sp. BI001-red]